ncbi:MAG: Lin1244/Lin1753 domain-containing protein [Patescibacteria group bacterium]
MARTVRNTVDYFPHFASASEGDTLTILQERFGNDGYAFWFRLLERLASTDGHCIDCRNPTKKDLLFAKCHILPEKGITIVETLANLDAIDPEMWSQGFIWCQKFIDNLAPLYQNRRRELPKRPIISTSNNAIPTGKNCIICGKNLDEKRIDAKFCSDFCRNRAFRATDNATDKNRQLDNNVVSTSSNPITTDINDILTSKDAVEIPQRKKESKGEKEKKEKKEKNFEFFSSFWEIYPVKTTKAETMEYCTRMQLDGGLDRRILTALERQIKAKAAMRQSGQFTPEFPDPIRWLRKARWEDEFPTGGQIDTGKPVSGTQRSSEGRPRPGHPDYPGGGATG